MEQGDSLFGISKTNPLFNKSDLLSKKVYQITRDFPKHEIYGLTSQLRRAALSVTLNIVEGFARHSQNEFRHFLLISFGSLKETSYLLYFAFEQNYLAEKTYQETILMTEEVSKIIWKILHP